MVIGAVKVPAVNPDVFTLKMVEPEPVPAEVERVSQLAASEAVQPNVAVPVLVIVSVWFPGFGPPCTPVNENDVALKPMVGVGAGVMLKVTGMVCGVLVAPPVIVITAE